MKTVRCTRGKSSQNRSYIVGETMNILYIRVSSLEISSLSYSKFLFRHRRVSGERGSWTLSGHVSQPGRQFRLFLRGTTRSQSRAGQPHVSAAAAAAATAVVEQRRLQLQQRRLLAHVPCDPGQGILPVSRGFFSPG